MMHRKFVANGSAWLMKEAERDTLHKGPKSLQNKINALKIKILKLQAY